MQQSRRTFLGGAALLMTAVAGCLGDDEDSHAPLEVTEFDVIDRETGSVAADFHDDHWHGSLPSVPLDGTVELEAHVEDADGESVELGGDATFELRAEVPDDAPEGIVEIDNHGDHVDLTGLEEGLTEIVLLVWHDDHAEFETPGLDVQVVAE